MPDAATPCHRCGDFIAPGTAVPLWDGHSYCELCCRRGGDAGFMQRMRASPIIEVGRRGKRSHTTVIAALVLGLFGLVVGWNSGMLPVFVPAGLAIGAMIGWCQGSWRLELRPPGLLTWGVPWLSMRRTTDFRIVKWRVYQKGRSSWLSTSESYLQVFDRKRRLRLGSQHIPLVGDPAVLDDLAATLRILAPDQEA